MRSIVLRIGVMLAVIAATTAGASAEGFGYEGWGLRAGVSESPDQLVVGAHLNLGEFAPGVRFQPSLEAGFGDDVFTLAGNLMVSYYFPIDAAVTPYAGGEISAIYYDFDSDCGGFGNQFGNFCDDSETEIGPAAVGGIEMDLSGGTKFLAEIQVGFSDLPDVKLMAGWTF